MIHGPKLPPRLLHCIGTTNKYGLVPGGIAGIVDMTGTVGTVGTQDLLGMPDPAVTADTTGTAATAATATTAAHETAQPEATCVITGITVTLRHQNTVIMANDMCGATARLRAWHLREDTRRRPRAGRHGGTTTTSKLWKRH